MMANKLNSKPLVAVITRTKDRPLLLERAIKSVLGQSFNDYAMVIINDGGDPKVVEDLVSKYREEANGRINIIHNKASIGMQAASNKAIKSIKSKYVVVHDDDDRWHEDFLSKTTEHLEKTNVMGVVVSTDLIVEEINGETVETIKTERLFPALRYMNLYKMCLENYATPISFIFNRSIFDEIGYYDESLRGFGDWDFGLRFLSLHDIDFMYSDQALAYYHQRPNTKGINKNSVFTDDQQYLENLITNRYLRKDISEGKLGIGYVMNSIRKSHFDNQAVTNLVQQNTNDQNLLINESLERLRKIEQQIDLIKDSSFIPPASDLKNIARKINTKLNNIRK